MAETATIDKSKTLRKVSALTERARTSLQERDRLIVDLHSAGVTPTEIGKAAGVTRGRVHQIIWRVEQEGEKA